MQAVQVRSPVIPPAQGNYRIGIGWTSPTKIRSAPMERLANFTCHDACDNKEAKR
jgi:hypothetical protein